MFLTKKDLRKVIILSVLYIILAIICFAMASASEIFETDVTPFNVLAVFCCGFSVISVFFGIYNYGKGKLIIKANKLLQKELRPAEFLKEYEKLKNSDDLVINKPGIDVLQLVFVAYDLLDDKENGRKIIEEIVNSAPEKKKAFANLLKVSALFSYGETDEAEKLFNEIRKQKLSLKCKGLEDCIIKIDRAFAFGDYTTVENYCLTAINRPFPKLNNLNNLVFSFKLAETYQKMQNNEKALTYYEYCAQNGGETAVKADAVKNIEIIKGN